VNFASARLFSYNGTTIKHDLSAMSSLQWLDALEETGSFQFTIPVEYVPNITIGDIVKIAYGDASDDYVFAGVVENLTLQQIGSGSDGIARTWQVSGRGATAILEDALVLSVGGANPNVRTFTSTNAGAIMKNLLDAAQARSVLTYLTYNFTNSVDSNGNAYTTTNITIDEQVGTNLLAVAERHQEIAIDYFIDPDGGASGALQLRYVNSRGTDRSTGTNPVVLRVGQNVLQLADQRSGPVRNYVYIDTGTGYSAQQNAGSVSTYGRRETFLSMTSNTDATLQGLAATHILNQQANPTDGTTIQLAEEGPVPYIDFGVGDTVLLARLDGTRTAYRVRSISATVDEGGNITFVPELGTARADLTKRLNAALQRAERQNAAESVVADTPGGGTVDLEGAIGEEIPEFVFGEVLTYDQLTGYGTIDVDGTTYDFYNGAFADLNVGDIIFGAGGDFIAGGPGGVSGVDYVVTNVVASSAGYAGGYPGGSNTQITVPIGAVPGLPYSDGSQFSIWGTGDGCVWSTAGKVVSYTDAQTYNITRPSSSWDQCWGLNDSANGPWVFVNRGVSSNGLHIVYNGTGTTSNYGNCQVLGTHSSHIWVWAGFKAGVADRRLLGISSTGTIAYDFTNASLNVLATGSNGTVGRAGGWGIVLWDGVDVVTVATPTATPAYVQYTLSTSFPSLPGGGGTGNTAIERTCVSDTSLMWISTTTTDLDWRRWEFGSAARYDYLNVLPAGFVHDRIATTGGSGVVIAGDDGSVQAYAITNGGAVTVTTFTGTSSASTFECSNNPDYDVIAATVASAAPNAGTLIGVT